MLPTREELGIREVDTAEALAAAGLTHVRYEAGDEVPWEVGLYLLDVATGRTEGWTCHHERYSCSGLYLSPSNRFLALAGYVHDRETDRTYAGAVPVWRKEHYPGLVPEFIGWGADASERLLVQGSAGYTVLDSLLRPVAQRVTLPARSPAHHGRYVAAIQDNELRIADLDGGGATDLIRRALPSDIPQLSRYGFDVGRGGVVLMVPDDAGSTRIIRYDWDGSLRSDVVIPHLSFLSGWKLPSPSGNLVAGHTFEAATGDTYGHPRTTTVSIFNTATGEEVMRIPGAGDAIQWLGNDRGVIVTTVLGERIATLEGQWEPSQGRPAPGDPSQHFEWGTTVRDRTGNLMASLELGPIQRTPDFVPLTWAGWGDHGGELRVVLHGRGIGVGLGDAQIPPLAPVIEFPPFEARLLVEVVVDTCLNLREEPRLDAPIVTCLRNGTVAETDDFWIWGSPWMHIRTDDGVEGWAHADYLRWHSDGVRLEQ